MPFFLITLSIKNKPHSGIKFFEYPDTTFAWEHFLQEAKRASGNKLTAFNCIGLADHDQRVKDFKATHGADATNTPIHKPSPSSLYNGVYHDLDRGEMPLVDPEIVFETRAQQHEKFIKKPIGERGRE